MDDVIRNLAEISPIEDLCGLIYPVTTAEDFTETNVAFLKAESAPRKSHFHKKSTEIYIIIKGYGMVRLDNGMVKIGPGNVVLLRPRTIHKLVPNQHQTIEAWVISSPAWSIEDQYEVDD